MKNLRRCTQDIKHIAYNTLAALKQVYDTHAHTWYCNSHIRQTPGIDLLQPRKQAHTYNHVQDRKKQTNIDINQQKHLKVAPTRLKRAASTHHRDKNTQKIHKQVKHIINPTSACINSNTTLYASILCLNLSIQIYMRDVRLLMFYALAIETESDTHTYTHTDVCTKDLFEVRVFVYVCPLPHTHHTQKKRLI